MVEAETAGGEGSPAVAVLHRRGAAFSPERDTYGSDGRGGVCLGFCCETLVLEVLRRVAPIFSVTDVEASLVFYASLGFRVRTWSGRGYGFAARDGIELHLGDSER